MEGLGCIKLQAIIRLLTGLDIEICSACANAEQDPEGRLIKAFNGQPKGGEWDEEWLMELLLVDCFLCTPEEGGVFVLAGGLNYSERGKLTLILHSQRGARWCSSETIPSHGHRLFHLSPHQGSLLSYP
ncbi:unnamed protein product [Lepidochelys kempii]